MKATLKTQLKGGSAQLDNVDMNSMWKKIFICITYKISNEKVPLLVESALLYGKSLYSRLLYKRSIAYKGYVVYHNCSSRTNKVVSKLKLRSERVYESI